MIESGGSSAAIEESIFKWKHEMVCKKQDVGICTYYTFIYISRMDNTSENIS